MVRTLQQLAPIKKEFTKALDETGFIRHSLLDTLIKAGANGITSKELKKVTGQASLKLARQSLRKSRFFIWENGYRLVFNKERNEDGYKIYRVVKISKDFHVKKVEANLHVKFYPVQKAA
jgi:hypothetical protein